MSAQTIVISFPDSSRPDDKFTCVVESGKAFTLPELDNPTTHCAYTSSSSSHQEIEHVRQDDLLGLLGTTMMVIGALGLTLLAVIGGIIYTTYLGYRKYRANKKYRTEAPSLSTKITDSKIKL